MIALEVVRVVVVDHQSLAGSSEELYSETSAINEVRGGSATLPDEIPTDFVWITGVLSLRFSRNLSRPNARLAASPVSRGRFSVGGKRSLR